MELKLIIFDVDGTLYDLKSHCIPQSCTEAIRQLKRNKIRFAIASGRAHYGMGKALNDLRADYHHRRQRRRHRGQRGQNALS